jgi:3',5'-cyclic AMP phosphodiesterase CpdA
MAKYKLIHLSDLHIGNSEKEFKNTNKIVKSIGTSYKGVPVIITGDLAHSATKVQFKYYFSTITDSPVSLSS